MKVGATSSHSCFERRDDVTVITIELSDYVRTYCSKPLSVMSLSSLPHKSGLSEVVSYGPDPSNE